MTGLGSKADNLVRLRDEFGVTVPPFIAVPFSEVIADFDSIRSALEAAINRFLADGDEKVVISAIADVTTRLTASEGINALHLETKRMQWHRVSCRTSATLEDGDVTSFAGQYDSFLDVEPSIMALRENVLACFRSLFALRVLRYARTQGLAHFDIGGSVIVQRMFVGTQSGVLFSENGSGALTVATVESARNTVVDGSDATQWIVPRSSLDDGTLPAHISELCRTALVIERAVGRPVDVEWSFDGRNLAFLQFRPITTPMLDSVFDWDSTNISENYPGVTLPLTYSVIRQLYAGVYPAFLRLLGTPEARLRSEAAVFDNMLGYVKGHVFYRISNWYEVLRFLPGRANQEFFEAMLNPVTKRGARANVRRFDLASVVAMTRFVWLLARSESRSRRFRGRFAEKLEFFASYHVEFVNAASILDSSKRVRQELLADWAVPILNDVKLMVFHGMLVKFFFDDEHRAEYLDFLQGLTDRASLTPLEELSKLGRVTAAAMRDASVDSISALRDSSEWPGVESAAKRYVTLFGARTPGELKLETERLTDHVDDVLELALKATGSTVTSTAPPTAANSWPAHIPIWKRPLLAWVAKHTRCAIDWRERFRFNRAQTFNLSRNSFDAIGKALVAEDLILAARDVYWLTEHEIDEIVNGHAWSLDAKDLIESRQRVFADYSSAEMPLAIRGAGRIAPRHIAPVVRVGESDSLAGSGVAPGILTASVVVATEFDPTLDVRGKILVVHHIDPGWTLLFTQAAGIVAERGNALSHAAIIAREIGIPAIVAVPEATQRLANGDVVTINGIVGSITRG